MSNRSINLIISPEYVEHFNIFCDFCHQLFQCKNVKIYLCCFWYDFNYREYLQLGYKSSKTLVIVELDIKNIQYIQNKIYSLYDRMDIQEIYIVLSDITDEIKNGILSELTVNIGNKVNFVKYTGIKNIQPIYSFELPTVIKSLILKT